MQGLLLAAAPGKHLQNPGPALAKCMVDIDGVTLIERLLRQLDSRNLTRIILVVGCGAKQVLDHVAGLHIRTPLVPVECPEEAWESAPAALAQARDWLPKEDTLLMHGDLIFEDAVLAALLDDPRETVALVDTCESWMHGTCVKLAPDGRVEAVVPESRLPPAERRGYAIAVNMYKFSASFAEAALVPFLDAHGPEQHDKTEAASVLGVLSLPSCPALWARRLSGQRWYEIDDLQDLDLAASIFAPHAEDMARGIEARYGGYWRYPHMKDFCYLVDPYYPPPRLVEELKENFATLLTQYPSGMRVNSLLAAKNFGIREDYILVGNGAAELIKSLMEGTEGKVGFIRPTFEEYPNRFPKARSVVFDAFDADEGGACSVDDIMAFFSRNRVDTLILINPDNPTGNFLRRPDLLRLAQWCAEQGIRLVVDESFVDFAEEYGSLLENEVLERFPGLIVVKSVSKSYGVPGLRLGILASSDTALIASMKKDLSIWNINSFAEFYLQIADRYEQEYREGLAKFRQARAAFVKELAGLPGLRVFPSQGNYLLVELLNGMRSRELLITLLRDHNILIKDLSSKIQREGRQFVRLAVRSTEDNRLLVDALGQVLRG